MLIAAPPLGDPNFDRTVVLLAVHGADGALGFVVNRTAPMTLGELLMRAGYRDAGITDESPVYLGGPENLPGRRCLALKKHFSQPAVLISSLRSNTSRVLGLKLS
jgi:putative AlgH/UPF0301 family transcriptional regulator